MRTEIAAATKRGLEIDTVSNNVKLPLLVFRSQGSAKLGILIMGKSKYRLAFTGLAPAIACTKY